MLRNKFRGRLDRAAVIREMAQAVRAAKDGGAQTVGVNAEDGSRTDDAFLTEFALAAKEAGADRLRYCDTIGGDTPGRIGERFAKLASAVGMPVETHCHNDLGMAVANSVAGALGDLDAGQDAWINTCVNGIGERVRQRRPALVRSWRCATGSASPTGVEIGDPLDLTWARRFALWAAYAFGQPLPCNQPGVGRQRVRARVGHPRRRRAQGPPQLRAVRRGRCSARSRPTGTPAPGRVVLTGEYGGLAGFRHVMDGLGVEVDRRGADVQAGPAVQRGDRPAAHRRRAAPHRRVPARARPALPRPARLTR